MKSKFKFYRDKLFNTLFHENLSHQNKHLYIDDLEDCEKRFYAGEPRFLFEALRRAAQYGIPAPDWTRYELEKGLDRFDTGEVKTFSEAFSMDRPKGAKLDAIQRKNEPNEFGIPLISRVWMEIHRLHKEGQGIGDGLFGEVAEKFGLSTRTVSNYYYEVKKIIDKFSN